MPKIKALVVLIILFATGLAAQQVAPARIAEATDSGLSSERLTRLDRVLQQHVDENRIAGAVALVLRDGRPVYERAVGWRDKEADSRMTTDTIFRIASQTKAITSVAILMLMEEGRLTLSTPVSQFIPAFAKTQVVVTGGSSGTTEPARRAITIRDLLTHLGCVVERASGMPLNEFIAKRITLPLGMKDTHFFLPAADRDRLAVVYASGADDRIGRAPEGPRGQGHYVEGPRKNFSGGAGLLCTARDYARFLEMTRNGGALDGVRILAPRTIALMTTNQVGTLHSTTGLGIGLGFGTVDRYGAYSSSSVGSYRWGGAYGSNYLVDPEARMVMVFMLQLLPSRSDLGQKFPNLVYQALIEPLNAEHTRSVSEKGPHAPSRPATPAQFPGIFARRVQRGTAY